MSQEGIFFPTLEAIEEAGLSSEGAIPLTTGGFRVDKVARNDISRRKLGVNEKNALTGAVTAAASLDSIEQEFDSLEKKGKVGPIRGRVESAKQAMGIGDREFTEFSAQTSGTLFNLARSLQGAGVLTEKDIQRMESIVPTGNMEKEQFAGQMAGVRSLMADKLRAWKIVNDESLSPEQRAQIDGILTRIDSKATKPPAQPGTGTQPAPAAEIPTINSQAEYDALPKGTSYRDSNGKTATKR